ncbi:hypothetical protein FJZ53_00530 [Candidatus Woesearchaeota archaeon]|nr:hypothetical protein [Candidatus Woesearchaeota archaeon]
MGEKTDYGLIALIQKIVNEATISNVSMDITGSSGKTYGCKFLKYSIEVKLCDKVNKEDTGSISLTINGVEIDDNNIGPKEGYAIIIYKGKGKELDINTMLDILEGLGIDTGKEYSQVIKHNNEEARKEISRRILEEQNRVDPGIEATKKGWHRIDDYP